MRTCLQLSLGVIAVVSMGCASTGAARRSGTVEAGAKRALTEYLDCVYEHADAMAGGSPPVSRVAESALASCERQHARYCTRASEYLTSVASPEDKGHAQARAQAGCSQTREEARGVLIGRIENARAGYAERLEQALAEAAQSR